MPSYVIGPVHNWPRGAELLIAEEQYMADLATIDVEILDPVANELAKRDLQAEFKRTYGIWPVDWSPGVDLRGVMPAAEPQGLDAA